MSAPPLRPRPGWASATGVAQLPAVAVGDVSIRVHLEECLARYCWGFDERLSDTLADCFTPDAIWSGHVMGETQIGPFTGREQVLTWLTGFWPYQRDQRRHIITTMTVTALGETPSGTPTAEAHAYLLLVGTKRRTTTLECSGLYRLSFSQEVDGQWRISHLTAGFDSPFWSGEVEDMEPWVRQLFGITAHRPS